MKMAVERKQGFVSSLARLFASQDRDADLRGERQEAVRRAYALFAKRYPRWSQSLFDEYFVTHTADHLLTSGLLRPAALADAWTRQLTYEDEAQRQRHVCEVIPLARIFVRLVRAEMV